MPGDEVPHLVAILGCGRAQRKDDLESAGQMLEKGGRGRPFLDPQPTSALPSPISPGVG